MTNLLKLDMQHFAEPEPTPTVPVISAVQEPIVQSNAQPTPVAAVNVDMNAITTLAETKAAAKAEAIVKSMLEQQGLDPVTVNKMAAEWKAKQQTPETIAKEKDETIAKLSKTIVESAITTALSSKVANPDLIPLLMKGVKDQATLLNLYQDEKSERRSDRIDDKICDTEKEGIRQTGTVIAAIKDCCCENQVAIAELNGKVDLNAEKALNSTLQSEMRLTAKMDADTIANMRHADLLKSNACEFAARGIFPVTTTCKS